MDKLSFQNDVKRALREALLSGITVGGLIKLIAQLYQEKGQPLSKQELIQHFDEAFELQIGLHQYLIHHFSNKLTGIDSGNATCFIYSELLASRARWDITNSSANDKTHWLDSIPSPSVPDRKSFEHPHIPEWDALSELSQAYIIRLALSGVFHAANARIIACLAERLQEKLGSSPSKNSS